MKRPLTILAAAVLLGLLLWLVSLPRYETSATVRVGFQNQDARPKTPAAVTPTERSSLADALNSPAADIRSDLRLVAAIVETFRSNFPRDGNPVGNNADITAALTGKNKLRLSLIPPDHPAISAKGELCDRWGTPFFFHAESATQMEIRSAGPDKKMWSADDVVNSP